MSSTSGTNAFQFDLNTLVEEAFDRCGAELRTGYDLRTAARSLNLLTIDWANRGINLWTIQRGEIPLLKGVSDYALPVDTIDLLDHVIRTGIGDTQTDISINRISLSVYTSIPNKNSRQRPLQVVVNRATGTVDPGLMVNPPSITIWPIPDRDNWYTFVYWRMVRIEDAGDGQDVPAIPFRFIPALVAGLAYYLAKKLPDGMNRLPMLKADYDEAWQAASDEDREKAPVRFVPRQMFI
jgi:hypothetical protein